jgi:DNA integrity scanning protein DisA with diadenylate cyclase activity
MNSVFILMDTSALIRSLIRIYLRKNVFLITITEVIPHLYGCPTCTFLVVQFIKSIMLREEHKLTLCIKMEGLSSHGNMFLLFHSQRVSTQIGHRKAIREAYINDGIHIKITMLGLIC